ncbi:hypothetical protein BJV82DRAFT_575317 [Fennellomyces sp. T-0311]|nr:hypothetical protein BJV82DRAFT_575317 [Fennellomyces sp. T-0311]
MAPRRIFNNNNNSNNNNSGRVVTLGGGGGLNERFSQLDKSKKQPQGQSSVFSRIRGNTNANGRRNPSSIQNRLTKPVNSGVRKRTGPTPMQGVQRAGRGRNVVAKGRGQTNNNAQQRGNQNNRGNNKQQRGGRAAGRGGRANDKARKPVSAQDLDKSLDDYMMKDPKTAQSRLDAELNSYMDEAGDVLMDL